MAKIEYKEPIVVRKSLDFGLESDDIPKYWMAGSPFITRLIDVVQSTFPDGERYFIRSVMAYKPQINDPSMLAEVQDFAHQEGQHGKVHTDYNNRLDRQPGVSIGAFTSHTRRITETRLKRFPKSYNLAMTAAFEHFTAMLADLFFANKYVLDGADPRVRAMLAWHAVEEMEHKAVAYDVMQQVAKVGYFQRCLAMTHASFMFTMFIFIAPWFLLKMDGLSFWQRCKAYAGGMGWMFGPRRGLFVRMLPSLARYYRPGFHPNDLKTVHNYANWLHTYTQSGDPVAAGEAMYAAAY